jgi:hypothetical protein
MQPENTTPRHYADCIEDQHRAISISHDACPHLRLHGAHVEGAGPEIVELLNSHGRLSDMIAAHEPAYLERAAGDFVNHAANSLPDDVALSREEYPLVAGWMSLAEPRILAYINSGEPTKHLSHVGIRGLFWHPTMMVYAGELVSGMGFWPFTFADPSVDGNMLYFLPFNRPAMGWNEEETQGNQDFAKWQKALWTLASQEIIVSSSHAPPRDVRRRMMARHQKPTYRVVHLPRLVPLTTVAPSSTKREWHARWAVSGHWRNQPCGIGNKQRKFIWIAPHIKGPPDREIKIPRRRLFVIDGGPPGLTRS